MKSALWWGFIVLILAPSLHRCFEILRELVMGVDVVENTVCLLLAIATVVYIRTILPESRKIE